jgi:hypothetical protein
MLGIPKTDVALAAALTVVVVGLILAGILGA